MIGLIRLSVISVPISRHRPCVCRAVCNKADYYGNKDCYRQKHIPLNSYVSLNKPIYEEDSDRTLLDVISGVKVANPEDMIISREEFSDIESKMNDILSDLEWKVLMSYLDGKSYQEIAAELGRHIKIY